MSRKKTTKIFVDQATQVHGDLYDYSLVEYKDARSKVKIIDPEYGEFWQTPDNHLRGQGNPFRSRKSQAVNQGKGVDAWVQKAINVHGDRYEYSKVLFTNSRQKVAIICKQHGEFWQSMASHVRGSGCPDCAGRRRIGIEELRQKAKERRGECLSDAYINTVTKYEWRCSEGHVWKARYAHVLYRNQWCPECAKNAPKTVWGLSIEADKKREEVKKINDDFKNKTKLECICPRGHVFDLTLKKLKSGIRCPLCKKQDRAYERFSRYEERCRMIASQRGGVLVDTVAKSGSARSIRFRFKCAKDHEWVTSATSVIHQTSWCPHCAGQIVITLDDLQSLAANRGGRCLSTSYTTVDDTYEWECSLGHRWSSRFSKAKKGQWCPTCAKAGISEELCRTAFEHIFESKFPKKRPKWLRSTKGFQMELDGYSSKLGIAFEYHGRQHFEYVSFYYESPSELAYRKSSDKLKQELCRKHGVKLFILTHHDRVEDYQSEILKQADNYGMDVGKLNYQEQPDYAGAYIREDRIHELRDVVKAKKGLLLSTVWMGTKEKYRVRCLRDNHEWETSGSELLNGAWCKVCAMSALQKSQRGSIADVVQYAEKYEGKVLSETYLGAGGKYSFQCKDGHTFEAKLSNLKHRNQWCPYCEGRGVRGKFRSFEEARKYARALGLRSAKEWKAYARGMLDGFGTKPTDIPIDPAITYRHKGWCGWDYWLGKSGDGSGR